MFDKPAYRDASKTAQRCIIPYTGFFEWRWVNGGKVKYPYFIHLKDEPMAGSIHPWLDKTTGEEVYTYSVLTTRTNQPHGRSITPKHLCRVDRPMNRTGLIHYLPG